MFFQGIDGTFAINEGNRSVAVEKRNNRAGTAGHGQCADTNDAAAEKADDDASTVAEDTSPFIGNMAVAAMF